MLSSTNKTRKKENVLIEMAALYGETWPGKTMVYKWKGLFTQGR